MPKSSICFFNYQHIDPPSSSTLNMVIRTLWSFNITVKSLTLWSTNFHGFHWSPNPWFQQIFHSFTTHNGSRWNTYVHENFFCRQPTTFHAQKHKWFHCKWHVTYLISVYSEVNADRSISHNYNITYNCLSFTTWQIKIPYRAHFLPWFSLWRTILNVTTLH